MSKISVWLDNRWCKVSFEFVHVEPQAYKLPNLEAIKNIKETYTAAAPREPCLTREPFDCMINTINGVVDLSPYYNEKAFDKPNEDFDQARAVVQAHPPIFLKSEELSTAAEN